MSTTDAIILALTNLHKAVTAKEISDYILSNNLVDLQGKTPDATISSRVWEFVKKKDPRVRRFKPSDKEPYVYYLAKYEQEIRGVALPVAKPCAVQRKDYQERDLHPLLVAYLHAKDENCFTKTIHHEVSKNKTDETQQWVHPDLVSLRLNQPRHKVCQSLFNSINRQESIVLSSYEMKRSIHSDYELKRYFFQAVSNSSWANYGWLVALDIDDSDSMIEEMERLNLNFGIGIIRLFPDAVSSKVLFPARKKPLDFRTIDKLCNINKEFELFIDNVEKLVTADTKVLDSVKYTFRRDCDEVLKTADEVLQHCKDCSIPCDEEDF